MTRIGKDLFQRQQKDADGSSPITIKAKFIQLLGNDVSDLLNNNEPVMVGENKFQKVEINGAKTFEITSPE